MFAPCIAFSQISVSPFLFASYLTLLFYFLTPRFLSLRYSSFLHSSPPTPFPYTSKFHFSICLSLQLISPLPSYWSKSLLALFSHFPFPLNFFRSPEAQKLPYYASYGRIRLAIHNLCTSHYLDLAITFIICINVITMSLEHYSQPQVTTLSYGDGGVA